MEDKTKHCVMSVDLEINNWKIVIIGIYFCLKFDTQSLTLFNWSVFTLPHLWPKASQHRECWSRHFPLCRPII